MATEYDSVVVGGGFYGARLALMLCASRAGARVLLVEREPVLLGRASLKNQARVHGGYHYPRSILTSLRSRRNYARFVAEYADCVDCSFPHYYAVARGMSKVTASQFAEFCRRIEAPLSPAPAEVTRLFDASRIDSVFVAEECAFDAVRLRERLTRELAQAGVEVAVETTAVRVTAGAPNELSVWLEADGGGRSVVAGLVLNCTYSRVNELLARSDDAVVSAKHELTEMAVVEPPPELGGAAVTVMDGPFFSLMPYPAHPSRGAFTLSHVRYTPHCHWHDGPGSPVAASEHPLAKGSSRFTHMVRDAARYVPAMRGTRYLDSLWEVKTVMPRSEQDDSRPILLRRSEKLPGLVTVLGAKIDSVYDVEDAMSDGSRAGCPSKTGGCGGRPAPALASSSLTPHRRPPTARA